MLMLLSQYIDNACKYSIFGTTITIRVVQLKSEVIFSVHSFGPVIPMDDRERIFDRYYRSSTSSNRASGTGIGLSVAKRAALRFMADMFGSPAKKMREPHFSRPFPLQSTKRGSR